MVARSDNLDLIDFDAGLFPKTFARRPPASPRGDSLPVRPKPRQIVGITPRPGHAALGVPSKRAVSPSVTKNNDGPDRLRRGKIAHWRQNRVSCRPENMSRPLAAQRSVGARPGYHKKRCPGFRPRKPLGRPRAYPKKGPRHLRGGAKNGGGPWRKIPRRRRCPAKKPGRGGLRGRAAFIGKKHIPHRAESSPEEYQVVAVALLRVPVIADSFEQRPAGGPAARSPLDDEDWREFPIPGERGRGPLRFISQGALANHGPDPFANERRGSHIRDRPRNIPWLHPSGFLAGGRTYPRQAPQGGCQRAAGRSCRQGKGRWLLPNRSPGNGRYAPAAYCAGVQCPNFIVALPRSQQQKNHGRCSGIENAGPGLLHFPR